MEKIFNVPANNKGFQITFDNGLTASVIWGFGSYTENKYRGENFSSDAEVAVLYDGDLIDPNQFIDDEDKRNPYDTVVGELTADDVLDFLIAVRAAEPPTPVKKKEEERKFPSWRWDGIE